MNWLFWLLVSLYTVAALATVASIGQPRKPITPGFGAVIVAFDAALIVLLVAGWPA